MEMYKLAVFLILINFSLGWGTSMNIMATKYDNYLANKINESEVNDALSVSEGGTTSFVETVFESTTYVAGAVSLFFKMLYYTSMGLPSMLASEPFGFPRIIIDTITALQVIIYGIGIATFLRGVGVK